MTLNEYKLYLIRCEMAGDDDDEEEEEDNKADVDDDDGFYPKHYPLTMEENVKNNESQLFAFHKLRVEKLRSLILCFEYDATLPPNLCVSLCRYCGQFQVSCWGRVIGCIV
eukprot:88948_1